MKRTPEDQREFDARVAELVKKRASDKTLYGRARKKQLAGKPLTYSERQRLEKARDLRVARTDRAWKRAQSRLLDAEGGPRFAKTKWGWRVLIPTDYPGAPWSARDEIEIVNRAGERHWVTLVRLWFTGSDPRRTQWWSFVNGRQSAVVQHVPPPPTEVTLPEEKQAESLLDDDDLDRVTTGAGAAYLMARKKRDAEAQRG